MELQARNVNHAFAEAFWRIRAYRTEIEQTRNGPVIAFPEPVVTTYEYPAERVLFHAGRDANPVFHLMEALWMIAGRNDVAFLDNFNSRLKQYSDNGKTYNAAYGYRWRRHFDTDQLVDVIKLLRRDRTTRQAVIQIWDVDDLIKKTKDKACNTQILFDCRGERLNMTVFNRSNDIWWGAYGANAVHFSFLQEFVAHAVRLPLGRYRQVSNNLHLYLELYDAKKYLDTPPVGEEFDAYSKGLVRPVPIMLDDDYLRFLQDCEKFCGNPFNQFAKYSNSWFSNVALPMAMISKTRREGSGSGLDWAGRVLASDWRLAAADWIARRDAAKNAGYNSAQ